MGCCEGGQVMAFSSADVYQEGVADREVEALYKVVCDRVKVGVEPHRIAGAVSLHEVVEVACLGRISAQPQKEVCFGSVHADLEWAGYCRWLFFRHAGEVLGESIEGLTCGVVAEENAVLEMRSGEFVAQIGCKPYAGRQYVDHGAGLQMAEDALELVFVIGRADGEGVCR